MSEDMDECVSHWIVEWVSEHAACVYERVKKSLRSLTTARASSGWQLR